MKKRNPFFLLTVLLLTAVPLPAAKVYLVGYDTTGTAMKFGSGSNSNHYYKPAVSNHPWVAFIAPDPVYAQGPAAEFRASYRIAPLEKVPPKNTPQATLLFAGEKFFMASYPMPNWQIAGTPSLSACFALRKGTDGGEYLQLLGPNNGQEMDLDLQVTSPSHRLTISADGKVAAIGGQDGMLLIDIAANKLTKINLAGIPLESNAGNSIGLSADGDIVFFASKTLNQDGLTRIYCYERSSDTLEIVALAETAANLLVDAQVVATPDGSTVVFVATNYELWSGDANHGRGTQIIAATRQTSGDWGTSLCSIREHIDASEPSVSADGRFVAFRARTAEKTTYQVFRYDRLTQATILASVAVSGQPADAACEVPSISPNGRYLAFVSKAPNLGKAPAGLNHVWLSDLGPTLTGEALALPINQSSELPIHLVNASAGDTITWSSDKPLPGTITCAGGAVTANTPYPVTSLPWTFRAGATPGVATITITLQQADGAPDLVATIALEVFNPDIPRQLPVSTMKDGSFAPGGGLPPVLLAKGNLSENGTLAAFATTVSLSPDDLDNNFDIYLRQLNDTTGELTLLAGDLTLPAQSPTLAGNGATAFFIAGNNLYAIPTTGVAQEQLPDTGGVSAVAASYDGTVLALVCNGGAWLRRNGQMTRLGDQTGFTTPLLSRDGQTAAFLDSSHNVFVWTAADNAWRKLASDIAHVSMTLDGCTLYCQAKSNGALSVVTTGTGATTELLLPGLPDGVTTNNLRQLTISPNRRFLVYFRDVGNIQQLFRYDLAANDEVMATVDSEGQPGNTYSRQPLSISGAGDRILYATRATNLLPGMTDDGWELALAVFRDQAGNAPILRTTAATVFEDAEIIFPLEYESSFGTAVPTLLKQPQHGQAELLGPADGRDGYALRLIPHDPHFCGQDSVVIRLFDGSRSADTKLKITVKNVNDAPTWKDNIPAEATSHVLNEGQALTNAPALRPYAHDPDLKYAAITGEKLSFSLVNAPDWLTLDQDGRLATTAPPGYDIARRDQNNGRTVFDFSVRVTDNDGEYADLPMRVTVVNVNRPPVLLAFPAHITEGVPLPWAAFTLADPDPEDQGQLRLRFSAPTKGKWVRQAGGASGTEFSEADFPIIYQAHPGAVNTDTAQVRVVDGGNASSEPVDLAIRLRQVKIKMSELWSATGPNALLPAKIPGWALLSVPVDMQADGVSALRHAFGSALWGWDAVQHRYVELADQVQAGQGFWVLIAEGPILEDYIRGERPLAPTLPAAPGWHLSGPPVTDLTPANDRLFGGAATRSYRLVPANQTREGAGYWHFKK
ncbi:MAG TPA: hypothetical protein PLH67_13565 [Lentisphaeria bacterium]|nr:hypothetical protein [Lentisphaeria bacterium]